MADGAALEKRFAVSATWVRIPPSPPNSVEYLVLFCDMIHCWVLLPLSHLSDILQTLVPCPHRLAV